VADLFGITLSSHSHPWRALRVHLRRLAGLQLWNVTKYVAGRSADKVRVCWLAGWSAVLQDGGDSCVSGDGCGCGV
jgi:hypothetical protein